ncbi:MAG TPA: hypothetical protein VNX22_01430 [Acidobacteriaceae bacterium]|nr:hypothetical protein [Acidobacteriaceae bacterium]
MASASAVKVEVNQGPLSHENGDGIMQISEQVFREKFNRRPIEFDHNLGDHPAFSMDRLYRLFEMSVGNENLLYWDAGQKRPDQRWNEHPGRDFPPEDAFRRIRENGAWIILFGAQRDPEIAALLEQAMQQVQSLSGRDIFSEMKVRSAYIFITSPHRVTTYHIDRECNFLLQLHGLKTIHIFDQTDRELLPEEMLEKFWTKDNNCAVYKPEFQNRALTVKMKPGIGVHIPVNAPHWLQNGDDISVSLSLNFQFKNPVLGNIYRANYYLRRMGLNPTPPHKSRIGDFIKGHGMSIPVTALKTYKKIAKH